MIALYFVLAVGIYFSLTERVPGANDFYSRWVGARELLLHQRDPYADEVTREIQMGMFGHLVPPDQDQVAFAYPLYVVLVIAPLVTLSYAQAQALWMALLLCSAIGCSFALLELNHIQRSPAILATLVVWSIFFYPTVRGTFNGQVTIVSIVFLASALWAIDRKADVAAGVLLAFSTIKPQPIILLVPIVIAWAIWHRRSKMVLTTLGTMIGLIVIGVGLVPLWIMEFITAMGNYSQYQPIGPPAQTLSEWLVPGASFTATLLFSGVLIGGLAWRVVKTLNLAWQDFQPTLGWAALVTTLTAGRIGTPDQLLLLLPWMLWLSKWLRQRAYGRSLFLTLAVIILPWLVFFATLQGDTEQVVVVWVLPLLTLGIYLWRKVFSSRSTLPETG